MDPITAFQMAAAVIGIVDFGSRLLSDTHEIYKSGKGHTARDVELSTLSQDLSSLSTQLQSRLSAASATPEGPEAVLLDITRRCIEASARLQKAVSDLQASVIGGSSKISIAASSFVSALKAVWKKSEIEGLKEDLAEIRSQMTIATLVSVWGETRQDGQRHIDLKGRLDEIATKLDRRDEPARQFAKELMQITLESDSAPASRRNAELVKILWHIDLSFWATDHGGTLFKSKLAERPESGDVPVSMRILSSLAFNTMLAREEAIPKAYQDTFKWIFQEEKLNKQDEEAETSTSRSFPRWLQDPTDFLYWITGKPGSGKSTLMKYVFENPNLSPYLESYAGDLPLMLAGFFFWNPGSEMQKSHEGLLRTLLYQCLSARKDLIPTVTPRRWALYNLLGAEAVVPDWTWRELKESFETLCSYHGQEFRLAFFIDGLDEFKEAEHSSAILINWIKDAIARFNIKFCISSRPWNIFSDAFGKHSSLMMQDLTRKDIDYFVQTEFAKSGAFQELKAVFCDDANRLTRDIIEKAEGVFLWVSLVVKSLLATLTDTPSLALLNKRLADIPSDIVGMYNAIWNSIPADRLGTASKIFQLCELQPEGFMTNEATFWLACEGPAVRTHTVLDETTRPGISKILRRMLDGHTRGICELSSNSVQFLHRSARDWALGTDMWTEILEKGPVDFQPELELLEAFLIQAPTDRSLGSGYAKIFNCAMVLLHRYGFAASSSTKSSDVRLIKALDGGNRLLCDFDAASPTKTAGTSYHRRPISSKDPNPEGFSSCHWLGLQMGDSSHRFEHSFVGGAARAGLSRYVKAKVMADKSLLIPKAGRVSLLENAIFHDLESFRDNIDIYYSFLWRDTTSQRLEIIRFLLGTSNTCYETALGDSMYDTLSKLKAEGRRLRGLVDLKWYDEVLRLLEEHGYCQAMPASPKDDSKQEPKSAQEASEENGSKSDKLDRGSGKVKERHRFSLSRLVRKLRRD